MPLRRRPLLSDRADPGSSPQKTSVTPRLLRRGEAAAYCALSVPTFLAVCPVVPVALGNGKRLERYDIRSLDNWIDVLGSKDSSSRTDWLATWDKTHDGRSREGG